MKKAAPTHDQALRREIARVACFEVQILSRMLSDYIEKNDSSGENAPAMRSGLSRLSKLSDIIFETAIAEEPNEPDEDMLSALGGRDLLCEAFRGSAA